MQTLRRKTKINFVLRLCCLELDLRFAVHPRHVSVVSLDQSIGPVRDRNETLPLVALRTVVLKRDIRRTTREFEDGSRQNLRGVLRVTSVVALDDDCNPVVTRDSEFDSEIDDSVSSLLEESTSASERDPWNKRGKFESPNHTDLDWSSRCRIDRWRDRC